MTTQSQKTQKRTQEKDTSIKCIVYFKELHYFASRGTAELIQKPRNYQFNPFVGGFLSALNEFRNILVGTKFSDLTPQKIVIYENDQLIFQIPQEKGTAICEDRRQVTKLAFALNQLERYKQNCQKEATKELAHVPRTKVESNEQQERAAELRNLRNSIYSKINTYCKDKLGYPLTKANNHVLYEKVAYSLGITEDTQYIESVFDEYVSKIEGGEFL